MSMIPDCRSKFSKNYFTQKKMAPEEINPYWYKILTGSDADYLAGFDFLAEYIINGLFEYLSDHIVNFQIDDAELQECVEAFCESERDILVTSMIENMDDDLHQKRLKEVEILDDDPFAYYGEEENED